MNFKFAKALSIALICGIGWVYWPDPDPTLLSLRIGSKFEEVTKTSSYPVEKNSNPPHKDEGGFGYTFITEPSVVIKFDAPRYGFILPPTTFAAIAYSEGKVSTIRTSPSLRTLSFSEAVSVFSSVQTQLQKGGWQLKNSSSWIDLSPGGVKQLHYQLNNDSSSHMRIVSLRAPGKYAMYFSVRRAGENLLGFDRYLVELSIGPDHP